MHESYADIRKRIAEPPLWWDEEAVPRYVPFGPSRCANVYADEAVYLEIACQNCGHRFMVAMTTSKTNLLRILANLPHRTLAESIRDGSLHYGDPPNIKCCPAGPTMNCDDLRVIEYWHRPRLSDWGRDPSLEIALSGPSHDERPLRGAL